jgi:hypothetical protein
MRWKTLGTIAGGAILTYIGIRQKKQKVTPSLTEILQSTEIGRTTKDIQQALTTCMGQEVIVADYGNGLMHGIVETIEEKQYSLILKHTNHRRNYQYSKVRAIYRVDQKALETLMAYK